MALLILTVSIVSIACKKPGAAQTKIPIKPIVTGGNLSAQFAGYYEPVKVDLIPNVPSYSLPLSGNNVQNLSDVRGKIQGPEAVWQKLFQNGFSSASFGREEDIAAFYENIKTMEIPVFVTSDSVLHLYHIQFDETLREIEEREFYPQLKALTAAFQEEMKKRCQSSRGIEKEAFKKGLAYFTVALNLLDPSAAIPGDVRKTVEWELKKIEEHSGFPSSDEAEKNAIFAYAEDYSQYVPRGHYTRSEELKRYFKGMMWYGRLTMLIKGNEKHGPFADAPALISVEEAEKQTILAASVAALLGELKADGRPCSEIWQRIYTVTAYYVGFADDLTPDDYLKGLKNILGDTFSPGALADPETLRKFQSQIAQMAQPAIYSGTGSSGVNLDMERGGVMSAEQLERILGKTQGFRMMGQRYVPDSYVLGQLVAPVTGLKGGGDGFTAVSIPDVGTVRAFPRGLDVMAVLGSERALKILEQAGDANYEHYTTRLGDLRQQFGKITTADWNRNLYWSWLYALKGLIEPVQGAGWPSFMTTNAWRDKQLNAALGSWSSLRHDTILYAKQSYTPTIEATSARPEPPRPKPVVGYVEPVPEFYARLVALTMMSEKGLDAMKVLDESSKSRLKALEDILARLQKIAEVELKNQELTENDYQFIRNFGEELTAVVSGVGATAQKTTLIADVHTDQNTGKVLEEGTGYIRLLLVAYKLPQGHILIGAGPSFSYFEFKHPMSDRLTDEKWRDILAGSSAPSLPDWTQSFAVF